MKKLFVVAFIGATYVNVANAGWLSDLFTKSEPAPTTLADACNLDEITTVCPEILLGQQTLFECLTANVKSVSEKCMNYVSRAVSENSDEITAWTEQLRTRATDTASVTADTATATAETVKSDLSSKLQAAKVEIANRLIASTTAE